MIAGLSGQGVHQQEVQAISAQEPAEETRSAGEVTPPPRTLGTILKQLGPGLIIAGSIVGSGELIVTTGLGARAGFILLWLIVLGCIVKVFVQVELGRYAVSEGATSLEAMNRMPGPRGVVSWLVWLWLLMYLSTCVQLAGILGGCAQVISCLGSSWSDATLAVVVAAPCALLLASGRYLFMERLTTSLVFVFTGCTVLAVVMLQWTSYAMTLDDLKAGLTFQLPAAENFVWAFAAFGITGVGASELIYYPYWCLEKGYARHVGPRDDSPAWAERARGWIRVMQVDAWTSLIVYTVTTVAFYFLGAAILHAKGVVVSDENLIPDLSHMYQETLGGAGLWIFLVGAFFVLASTFLVANASNARLFADALPIFGVLRYSSESRRVLTVRLACIGLPAFNLLLFVFLETPVTLVFVGALGQAVMLPLLALLALYLRYRRTDARLRPGFIWTLLLWVAFVSMAAIGIYQAYSKICG